MTLSTERFAHFSMTGRHLPRDSSSNDPAPDPTVVTVGETPSQTALTETNI